MYKIICPHCCRESFSASKKRWLSNPACPYCGNSMHDSTALEGEYGFGVLDNDTTSRAISADKQGE